ncbi:unnamed protein product [Zymoseptoria tritici ST99CH_1A5]|uniref:RING-type domain-containing protein n=1 Tax=Zymoseptoria tritici ST99CH_1A5 TaxID=1276529 RepID=A0A1Y6L2Z5_ZYMTR|nr:unnamed protein product [Zymoseptoria tritici ST99CH_1A5]
MTLSEFLSFAYLLLLILLLTASRTTIFGDCPLCGNHFHGPVCIRCDCIACEGCFRAHLALQDDRPLCPDVIFLALSHRLRMRAFKQETMLQQVEGALWLAIARFLLTQLLMTVVTPLVVYMNLLCLEFYIHHLTAAVLVRCNIDQRTDRSQWALGLMMAVSTGGAPVLAAFGIGEEGQRFAIKLLDCAVWLPLALLWVLGKVSEKK